MFRSYYRTTFVYLLVASVSLFWGAGAVGESELERAIRESGSDANRNLQKRQQQRQAPTPQAQPTTQTNTIPQTSSGPTNSRTRDALLGNPARQNRYKDQTYMRPGDRPGRANPTPIQVDSTPPQSAPTTSPSRPDYVENATTSKDLHGVTDSGWGARSSDEAAGVTSSGQDGGSSGGTADSSGQGEQYGPSEADQGGEQQGPAEAGGGGNVAQIKRQCFEAAQDAGILCQSPADPEKAKNLVTSLGREAYESNVRTMNAGTAASTSMFGSLFGDSSTKALDGKAATNVSAAQITAQVASNCGIVRTRCVNACNPDRILPSNFPTQNEKNQAQMASVPVGKAHAVCSKQFKASETALASGVSQNLNQVLAAKGVQTDLRDGGPETQNGGAEAAVDPATGLPLEEELTQGDAIALAVIGTAATGVGAYYGYKALRGKKKKNNRRPSATSSSGTSSSGAFAATTGDDAKKERAKYVYKDGDQQGKYNNYRNAKKRIPTSADVADLVKSGYYGEAKNAIKKMIAAGKLEQANVEIQKMVNSNVPQMQRNGRALVSQLDQKLASMGLPGGEVGLSMMGGGY